MASLLGSYTSTFASNSQIIFCIDETFLNDQYSDSELTIPNYNFIRKDRQSHGGGLIIYYKTNLVCIHRVDLESNNVEMLWLQIRNNKQRPFLLCYVYRPPSATSDWTDQVEQSLDEANTENKEIILLGDLNFNILNKTSSYHHIHFRALFSSTEGWAFWLAFLEGVLSTQNDF